MTSDDEIEAKDLPCIGLAFYILAAIICTIIGCFSSEYPKSEYAHGDMCNQNFKRVEVIFPWLSLGCWTGELVTPAAGWLVQPISGKKAKPNGKVKTYE